MHGWQELVYNLAFWVMTLLTVGGAAFVAWSKNLVRSGFALLLTFFGVAGLYALLEADFVAALQLLIYVGGILVLFMFAVMLTHKISDVNLSNESSPQRAAFAAVYVLWVFLVYVILATKWPEAPQFGRTATVEELGRGLMTTWLLPFEVVSLLLLVALIGAAYLARPLAIKIIEPLGSANQQAGSARGAK